MSIDNFVIISRLLRSDEYWLNARPTYQSIFFAILLRMAFYETEQDNGGKKVKVKPFQLYASLNQLAEWTNKWITKDDVEGALKYFSRCNFLLHEVLHRKSLITITQSDICEQILRKSPLKTPPSLLHDSSMTPPQNKNEKNEKNEKEEQVLHQSASLLGEKVVGLDFVNSEIEQISLKQVAKKPSAKNKKSEVEKISFKDQVFLSQEEYEKLIHFHGEIDTEWMLEKLNNYKKANNKKYVSDYAAIQYWVKEALEKSKCSSGFSTQSHSQIGDSRRTKDIEGKPVESPFKGRF